MIFRPFAILVLLAVSAGADTFDAALERWTAGDDMAALRSLADLAQAGDVEAQIFLGRIAPQSVFWPPEVAAMPRKKRNALLRAPGGLSGKSWVTLAADTDPRAAAFDAAARPGGQAAALMALMELGETNAVALAFPGFVSSGDWQGALALAQHPDAPPAMTFHLPGLTRIVETGQGGGLPAFRRTDLYPADAVADPDLLAVEGARIAALPEVRHFLAFCEASCVAEAVNTCMGAIFASATTDPVGLAASPVAALLSADDYRDSPRAVADAARAIDVTKFLWDQTQDPAIARLSSCAWDGVQASSSASQ